MKQSSEFSKFGLLSLLGTFIALSCTGPGVDTSSDNSMRKPQVSVKALFEKSCEISGWKMVLHVDKTVLVRGEETKAVFTVTNAAKETRPLPTLFPGTMTWYFRNGVTWDDYPCVRDQWIALKPGESVSSEMTLSWSEPGPYDVRVTLKSCPPAPFPFEPLTSPVVTVFVLK
jgi:hypothetical protein